MIAQIAIMLATLTMEADASTTHPNPVPNPHHRKIELQSHLDLTYLQNNIATSARQKLDLHFPPSASQPQSQPSTETLSSSSSSNPQHNAIDPMRQRVQELVSQFLERTWTGAKPSISINGQDATEVVAAPAPRTTPRCSGTDGGSTELQQPLEEEQKREGIDFEYEAYDARLSGRVASLYGELEALTTQVSKLRRTAPGLAAERYKVALLEALEEDQRTFVDDKGRGGEMEMEDGGVESSGRGFELDGVRHGWEADVAGMYERGLGELKRLGGHDRSVKEEEGSGSLTETVGKVQRAKVVAMELE